MQYIWVQRKYTVSAFTDLKIYVTSYFLISGYITSTIGTEYRSRHTRVCRSRVGVAFLYSGALLRAYGDSRMFRCIILEIPRESSPHTCQWPGTVNHQLWCGFSDLKPPIIHCGAGMVDLELPVIHSTGVHWPWCCGLELSLIYSTEVIDLLLEWHWWVFQMLTSFCHFDGRGLLYLPPPHYLT